MAKASKKQDAATAATKEVLPTWDLTEYYSSIEDPQIDIDLQIAVDEAKSFAEKYKGRVAELSGDELAVAIESYYAVGRSTADKVDHYAHYLKTIYQTDPAISKFEQKVNNHSTEEISSRVMFFMLEIKNMDADVLRAKVAESEHLQKYTKLIEDIVQMQPYKLSDEIEEFIVRTSPAGAGQFVRLYQEDQARRRYELRGEQLTVSEIRSKFSDADESVRKEAQDVYFAETARQIDIPVFIMNNILKHKGIMDNERGFAEPMSARNLGNEVDDQVVHTLIDTVIANYPATTQRYNALLAEMLGKEKLDYWDDNVAIPGNVETYVSWEEAKQIVLDGYREFSPQMADIAEMFFDKGWIDAEPRPGKAGGAFSSSGHPDMHPHVMLNYLGKPRDVMTLAHELGHGIHQYLETHNLGPILRGTPLNLAETASIFGEEIVFQKLLKRVETPTERKLLLAEKVSDGLSTITRQVSFADFERKIHAARKEGELSADDFANLWVECRKAEQGDQGQLNLDDYKHGWSNIPHIFKTPFYVYAYSFANLVVNGLAKAYEGGDVPNFEQVYVDALKAGGTKNYAELLEPFGIDATKPDFWQKGMDVLIDRIDQLEQAIADEKAWLAQQGSTATANDNEPVSVTSVKAVGAAESARKTGKAR